MAEKVSVIVLVVEVLQELVGVVVVEIVVLLKVIGVVDFVCFGRCRFDVEFVVAVL